MKLLKTLIITLALGLTLAAQAETRYVTDELKITLRSGESNNHRIIRMLPSGMPVQVLSSNAESGYSRVRAGNTEGYVLTRQLLREPAARDRLEALQKRVEALTAAPDKLRDQLTELTVKYDKLSADHAKLEQAKQAIEQEYATLQRTASSAVQIADERNALRKQVADLSRETADLKLRTNELENANLQEWFLAGGGVIIAGILIGLLLPNLKLRRRRGSWDSL